MRGECLVFYYWMSLLMTVITQQSVTWPSPPVVTCDLADGAPSKFDRCRLKSATSKLKHTQLNYLPRVTQICSCSRAVARSSSAGTIVVMRITSWPSPPASCITSWPSHHMQHLAPIYLQIANLGVSCRGRTPSVVWLVRWRMYWIAFHKGYTTD